MRLRIAVYIFNHESKYPLHAEFIKIQTIRMSAVNSIITYYCFVQHVWLSLLWDKHEQGDGFGRQTGLYIQGGINIIQTWRSSRISGLKVRASHVVLWKQCAWKVVALPKQTWVCGSRHEPLFLEYRFYIHWHFVYWFSQPNNSTNISAPWNITILQYIMLILPRLEVFQTLLENHLNKTGLP